MDENLMDWLRTFAHTAWSFLTGVFMAVVGYFLPVKNIVHLLVLFFVLDVLFGYWAAKKLRKEKFSARIIWKTTFPRMVISMVLIMGAYLWDTVYGQNVLATYKVIGWFISGVLLASIIQNGYHITRWNVLIKMGDFLGYKFGEKTGINFMKKEDKECEKSMK